MAHPTETQWTPAGLDAPTLDEWTSYLLELVEARSGERIVRDVSSPVYALILGTADGLVRAMELANETILAIDPATAAGEALDIAARHAGISRLIASPSTALVTLTGTAGVIVPAGTWVSDAATTTTFATDEVVAIGSGGTADAAVTAIEVGPATVDDVSNIVTPVAGLDSVALASGAIVSPGRNLETDAELRERLDLARFAGGRGTRGAIEAALQAVDGVQYARVYANRSDEVDAEYGGIPAHHYRPVIYPAVADALVGAALISQEPVTATSFGAESYTDPDDAEHTVSWDVATEVAVEVRVTGVRLGPGAPLDYAAQIAAAFAATVDELDIGDDLEAVPLYAPLGQLGWVQRGIIEVRIAEGVWGASVAIDHDEVATMGVDDVTVTLEA